LLRRHYFGVGATRVQFALLSTFARRTRTAVAGRGSSIARHLRNRFRPRSSSPL